MSLDYPLSSLSTYALLILNSMALLCMWLWSTRLPKLLHSLLSSIPIFHILIIQLPSNRIQQLHYFNISYPISQLLFLIALTLSMVFRNKIQYYVLIFITILYTSLANIYTVDFMITDEGRSAVIHKFCLIAETITVNIGLLLLIRPVKMGNIFNVSDHRQQSEEWYHKNKIIYTITAISVSISIIIYSIYFYKSYVSLIRTANNQNIILSTPHSHIRHNTHKHISNTQEFFLYFYNIYWIICPIVSGAIVGIGYSRIFEGFDGQQGYRSSEQYEKIEDDKMNDENENMNVSQYGDNAYRQLNVEKEKGKKKHYRMLACAFLVVCWRWASQFVF